ncbi:hypothetical protein Ndes2526B_g07844 [Nannochloris sp. 'desiccata']|nr:hypothetical protein KSW81_002505 [Chlorella desiccata (nom. nud.)]
MKQTIGNACGTIGLLHCVANSKTVLNFKPGSFLEQFLNDTNDLSPDARGKHLEQPPEGAISIDAIHEEAAQQGATEAPPADADVDLHFVAFVPGSDNHLWQLDGRKAGAIDHGETTSESLLRDVAAVVKKNFVEKANSLNFSLIALAAS